MIYYEFLFEYAFYPPLPFHCDAVYRMLLFILIVR